MPVLTAGYCPTQGTQPRHLVTADEDHRLTGDSEGGEQRPLEFPDHEWACPQGSSLTGCLKDLCFLPKLCVGEDFSGKHPDFNAMYVETTDLLKYPFNKD